MSTGEADLGTLPPMVQMVVEVVLPHAGPCAFEYDFSQSIISLGRDPSNDIPIPLTSVSRHHARVFFEAGNFFLEDLRSSHGTEHNQHRLEPPERRRLMSGDTIRILAFRITFSMGPDPWLVQGSNESTEHLVRRMVGHILADLGQSRPDQLPALTVMNGAFEGLRHILSPDVSVVVVGRSPACELTLDDENISRRHCLVRRDTYGFSVQDLGSLNGVQLNGQRLLAEGRLQDGDELALGPIKLTFLDPPSRILHSLGGASRVCEGAEVARVIVDGTIELQSDGSEEADPQQLLSEADQKLIQAAGQVSSLETVSLLIGVCFLLLSLVFIGVIFI
ncbi:MAG: FHA domain-containing protein [Myxococcales bacterium]|nr:FHA domain-containing protein [Myxococcales bacterium]